MSHEIRDCSGCAMGIGACDCLAGEDTLPGTVPATPPAPIEEKPEEIEELIEEIRAVDLDPPSYVRSAAEKGLELLEFAGEGLVERTIAEARAMARGEVSADKWRRMSAWLARHRVDLEGAPEPGEDGRYTPGQVAHLLWGSEPTLDGNDQTRSYAEQIVKQLDAEADERSDGEPLMKLEFRSIPVSLSETGDGYTYRGHIALFDSPSSPALGFTEVIKRGAFSKSLSAAGRGDWEVKAFQDHKPELFLGSTKTGSVSLQEDERGLLAEIRLNPDVSYAADLAANLKRDGEAMGASFGFTIPSKGDRWSTDGTTRELTNIRLHEVSLLTGNAPAYPSTVGLGAVRALAARIDAEPAEVRDAIDGLLNGEVDLDRSLYLRAILGQIAPAIESEPEPEPEPAPAEAVEVPASIRELQLRLAQAKR